MQKKTVCLIINAYYRANIIPIALELNMLSYPDLYVYVCASNMDKVVYKLNAFSTLECSVHCFSI